MTKIDHDHQKETPTVLRPERSWIKLALLASSVTSHSWKHRAKELTGTGFHWCNWKTKLIVVCCCMNPDLCHDIQGPLNNHFLTGCLARHSFSPKGLSSSHWNNHFSSRKFQVPGVYNLQRSNNSETKHIHKSQQNSFKVQVLPIQNGNMKTTNEANHFFFRMFNYETTKQKSLKQFLTNIFKNAGIFVTPMPYHPSSARMSRMPRLKRSKVRSARIIRFGTPTVGQSVKIFLSPRRLPQIGPNDFPKVCHLRKWIILSAFLLKSLKVNVKSEDDLTQPGYFKW